MFNRLSLRRDRMVPRSWRRGVFVVVVSAVIGWPSRDGGSSGAVGHDDRWVCADSLNQAVQQVETFLPGSGSRFVVGCVVAGQFAVVDDNPAAEIIVLEALTHLVIGNALGESDFPPSAGRQYVKVCGTVTAPEDAAVRFRPGIDANLFTDRGMGFAVDDDRVTDWSEVVVVPAGESRATCEVWEVPAGSGVVHYVVNNWLEYPGVYRVELFSDVADSAANGQK